MGKGANITIDKERHADKEKITDHKRDIDWTFIVVQEHPEWEPGTPQLMRQIVLYNDGRGQTSLIVDNELKELNEYQSASQDFKDLNLQSMNSLKDRYISQSDEDKGLIIEGYPTTIKFILSSKSGYRIIDSDLPAMPATLKSLYGRIKIIASHSHSVISLGTYISVQPMGAEEEKEVMGITRPLYLSSDGIMSYLSLAKAIEKPSVFVYVPEGELKGILKMLKLDSTVASHAFIMRDWGVAKINFYDTRKNKPQ